MDFPQKRITYSKTITVFPFLFFLCFDQMETKESLFKNEHICEILNHHILKVVFDSVFMKCSSSLKIIIFIILLNKQKIPHKEIQRDPRLT